MSIYTLRRLSALLLLSCAMGVIVVGLITWGINIFFPVREVVIQKGYRQLINYDLLTSKPSAVKWAQINHTIMLLGHAMIESTLKVTAKTEPPYSNVKVEIYFNPYDYLVPKVISGSLLWSGELHENETVTLRVILELDEDGKYFMGSKAISYFGTSEEGSGTVYYLNVEGRKIMRVTDERGEIPTRVETTLKP